MFRCKLFIVVLAIFALFVSNAAAQVQKAKVVITGPAIMTPGGTITYTVAITNQTDTTLTGVWIYHHFQNANHFLTFLPEQSTPGCSSDALGAFCPQAKNDTLAPRQTKFYYVAYKVPESVPCDTAVIALADVRANGSDPHWSSLAIKATCPVTPAVLPNAECVYNLGGGKYRAYFGYQNTGASSVGILPGTNTPYEANFFTPGSVNRGQPAFLLAGTKTAAFSVDFDGENLTWVLKPRFGDLKSVTVSKNSKACFPIKPIAECRDQKPNNQFLTYFGFQNDNPFTVVLDIPALNKFSPAPENRGQPSAFLPGRNAKVFSTTSETGLTWTLGGLSAQSNNLVPQCIPNAGPLCKVIASANTTCGGAQTSIALDGSQSSDPEGLTLNYQWTTDCANATFSNSGAAKPTLTINTNGQAVTCGVRLVVNDGLNNSTPCNSNIAVNSCATDCAGKPNGSSSVDRCGVCGGDGQSCLNCTSVDTTDTKFSLDIGVASQKHLVTKLGRRLSTLSRKNPKYKGLIDSSNKEAQALYVEAWKVAWTSFPNVLTTCTNVQFCQKTDYSASLSTYGTSSKRLKAIALKLLKQIASIRPKTDIKGQTGDKKLTQEANDLHAANEAVLATVPRSSSQCS